MRFDLSKAFDNVISQEILKEISVSVLLSWYQELTSIIYYIGYEV